MLSLIRTLRKTVRTIPGCTDRHDDSVLNWVPPQGVRNVLAWLVGLAGMAGVVGLPAVGDSLDSSVQTGGPLLEGSAGQHTPLSDAECREFGLGHSPLSVAAYPCLSRQVRISALLSCLCSRVGVSQ